MGLLEDWSKPQIDQTELQNIIFQYFNEANYGEKSISFKKEGLRYLTLEYTKKGKLSSVLEHRELDSEVIESIQQKIIGITGDNTRDVTATRFIFFGVPVKSLYRYENLFQIFPVQEHAPRPEYLYAPHPAYIQVKFKNANDQHVNIMRAERLLRRIELILAFLVGPFGSIEHSSGRKEWVYGDIIDGNITSELRQIGYTYIAKTSNHVGFAEPDGVPQIEYVDSDQYYNRNAGSFMDNLELKLPTNISESIDKIFHLDPDRLEALMRSCYWMHTSKKVNYISSSSSYVALVSAIESLLPKPSEQKCSSCNKPLGSGPTGLFRDFLETHLPGAFASSIRSRFYSIRSQITHGSNLLVNDEISFGLSIKGDNESLNFMNLAIATRAAIYNWLQAQK